MWRDATAPAEPTTLPNPSSVAMCVDFFLDAVFQQDATERQIRIARSVCGSESRVTLIPRLRPILAQTTSIDAFFEARTNLFGATTGWSESYRLREPGNSGLARVCVNLKAPCPRTLEDKIFDVLLTVQTEVSRRPSIRSATIVYDERPLSPSPVTIFA